MTELLPCPFCGGEAHTYRTIAQRYCAICGKPFCASVGPFDAEDEAIEAWNTRAERTCHDVKPSLPYFKCDSCGMEDMGETELWIQDGFYRSQKPNYCPNCGAKVVGE